MLNIMKLNAVTFFVLFLVNSANASNLIKIENAWCPEAPPVVSVMAGYMTISNLSKKDIRITKASSDLFKNIEIHLTKIENNMMKMVKQENLIIKANSIVELKPNGLHMMLMGKLKPIKSGTLIPLTISFNNGETITVKLKVKSDRKPKMKCGGGKCGSM